MSGPPTVSLAKSNNVGTSSCYWPFRPMPGQFLFHDAYITINLAPTWAGASIRPWEGNLSLTMHLMELAVGLSQSLLIRFLSLEARI